VPWLAFETNCGIACCRGGAFWRDALSSVTAPANAGFLETSNLCKQFGDFYALTDVNFSIAEGEFSCFLGPSGCGKTMLLRCIAGLETQTAGGIHLAGEDISWRPPSQRDFGIAFQSMRYFPI
jgi:iron(III) transport system ATP-binding protein